MSSNLVANFEVPLKTIKSYSAVVGWFDARANDPGFEEWRQQVKRESVQVPGKPGTKPKKQHGGSPAMRKALDDRFGQTGCESDASCLRYIFEHYIQYQDKKRRPRHKFARPVMRAINKLLPLMYPEIEQLGAYKHQVSLFNGIIRATLGDEFQKANTNYLQFAGGEETAEARKAFRVASKNKAAKIRAYNLNHAIPVPELDIYKAVWAWFESDELIHKALLVELMTYARKGEVIDPRSARFCAYPKFGYIHQFGVLKEKKKKEAAAEVEAESDLDEDELGDFPEVKSDVVDECGEKIPASFLLRRQVIKPILQIPRVKGDWDGVEGTYAVDDVLGQLKILREGLDVNAKIAEGVPPQTLAKIFPSKRITEEIAKFFPPLLRTRNFTELMSSLLIFCAKAG
jgi:hypothetical protein